MCIRDSGNWANSDVQSPMILQKSCHDMDIILWLMGKNCTRVSSYGSLKVFRPETVSYTHLDVYKRQGPKECVTAPECAPKREFPVKVRRMAPLTAA